MGCTVEIPLETADQMGGTHTALISQILQGHRLVKMFPDIINGRSQRLVMGLMMLPVYSQTAQKSVDVRRYQMFTEGHSLYTGKNMLEPAGLSMPRGKYHSVLFKEVVRISS